MKFSSVFLFFFDYDLEKPKHLTLTAVMTRIEFILRCAESLMSETSLMKYVDIKAWIWWWLSDDENVKHQYSAVFNLTLALSKHIFYLQWNDVIRSSNQLNSEIGSEP